IFHELAHQVVYVPDDSVFNESFAAAVEHEGVRRWFEKNGSSVDQAGLNLKQEKEAIFAELVLKHRKRLQELFQLHISDDEKRI
ncbi:aminopeptidase, partial [Streptobacillus moniliformis]|uniref:aminopeptidase n=1 Tax=Streptobacillus moniliformis TaxID=34105 RepID=UPI000A4184C3